MSRRMRRWLSWILVWVVIFTSCPQMTVFAENMEQTDQAEELFYEEQPSVILADGEEQPQLEDCDIATYAQQSAVSLETEEALYQYLKEQVAARNSLITVSVPKSIHTQLDPVNVMKNAWAYTESCTGQEGDALKFGGIGYRVQYSSGQQDSREEYTYYMSYYTTAEQEDELTKAVNVALESLNLDGKTDAEKVIAIHDYICIMWIMIMPD